MHFNAIFSTLALLSLTAAAPAPAASKVLKLPLTKTYGQKAHHGPVSKVHKRAEPELKLDNNDVLYLTHIKVGSNGQDAEVDVDTGSSDLWLDTTQFDSSQSDSFHDLGTPFKISYGDGSGASGSFGTDTVQIGDSKISDAQFAVASQNTAGHNIFGVGYALGEATVQLAQDGSQSGSYDNLPVSLKKQGIIDSNSYSLWLDSYTDAAGSILFGGVDHAKYSGTLGTVPVVSVLEAIDQFGDTIRPSKLQRLTVALNAIQIADKSGNKQDLVSDANVPVLLDSGTTLTYLPPDWVDAIANVIGYDQQYSEPGTYLTTKKEGTISYNFSGVEIDVPFDSFLRKATQNGQQVTDDQGNPLYIIGLQNGPHGPGVDITQGTIYILGDSFLSAAYVVYDLDNNEISLANAKTGQISQESIEPIGSSVPSATKAPNYSSTSSNTNYNLHTPTGLSF